MEIYKDYEYRITPDEEPLNPREDASEQCVGIMVCFHRRYNLGDKHNYQSQMFNGWEDIEAQIRKDYKVYAMFPIYLYDHSGIALSTDRRYPFDDRWDSGQVGLIFTTAAQYKKVTCRKVTKKQALVALEQEVAIYNQYVSGDVWHFIIEKDGEHVDSCGNWYGLNDVKKEVRRVIDDDIARIKAEDDRRAEATADFNAQGGAF